jgi:hypothetical protein
LTHAYFETRLENPLLRRASEDRRWFWTIGNSEAARVGAE